MKLDIWTESFDVSTLDEEQVQYLELLPPDVPTIDWVWSEMDRVWDEQGLDNLSSLSNEQFGRFYSHPVWVMNGIFTELDPTSMQHRKAISEFMKANGLKKIADYGGGSGVLAKVISETDPEAVVDVVEPYASDFFKNRLQDIDQVKFKSGFEGEVYDVAIAQDVLEHVTNAVEVAFEMAKNVKEGGKLIYANCFYPVIKCHLPQTFYLRYTFKYVMNAMGLTFEGSVPGANHALVFGKRGKLNLDKAVRAKKRYKTLGSGLNGVARRLSGLRKS